VSSERIPSGLTEQLRRSPPRPRWDDKPKLTDDMKKQVIIEFHQDGTTKIEAQGTKGRECEDLTKPYEEALGTVKIRHRKPEYNQSVAKKQQVGA
jgi:hypothetical protein